MEKSLTDTLTHFWKPKFSTYKKAQAFSRMKYQEFLSDVSGITDFICTEYLKRQGHDKEQAVQNCFILLVKFLE